MENQTKMTVTDEIKFFKRNRFRLCSSSVTDDMYLGNGEFERNSISTYRKMTRKEAIVLTIVKAEFWGEGTSSKHIDAVIVVTDKQYSYNIKRYFAQYPSDTSKVEILKDLMHRAFPNQELN